MSGQAATRVLVADDEEAMTRLIRRRLAAEDLDMVWARDGDEALALVRSQDFAAVVLDYRMPRRNGLEVLREIRGAGLDLPVVLMSGMGSLDVAVEAMRLGASDYVIKDEVGAYLDLLPGVVTRLTEHRRLIAERQEAQAQAVVQSQLLQATLESINQGLCVFDGELRLIAWNQRFFDLYGYPSELARQGTSLAEFLRLNALCGDYGGGDVAALVAARLDRARTPQQHCHEHVTRRGLVIEVSGAPMPGGGFVSTHTDISERKQAEEQLHLTQSVFLAAGEGMMVVGQDRRIEIVNPAFTEITGYAAEEVIGKTLDILRSGHHDANFFEKLWQVLRDVGRWDGDIWNRRKDGSLYAERMSLRALYDDTGTPSRYVAIFHDITHRKEDEERAWRRANYDALTELPNRALFLDRLQQAKAQADRDQLPFALLFIDLDGFKAVNDTMGHASGDDLLRQVARRLQGCVRSIDTVGRLGGDEFVMILSGVTTVEAAAGVADKILEELARPIVLDGGPVAISGSLGIALYPVHSSNLTGLMDLADHAMYAAKRGGRNRWVAAQA